MSQVKIPTKRRVLSRATRSRSTKTQTGKLTSWSDTLIDTDSFISASTGNHEPERIVFVSQVLTNPTRFDLYDCGPNEAERRSPGGKGTGRQVLCYNFPGRRGTVKANDNTKASALQRRSTNRGSAWFHWCDGIKEIPIRNKSSLSVWVIKLRKFVW